MSIKPFRDFVRAMTDIVDQQPDEAALLESGHPLLADLLSRDEWLPDAFSQHDLGRYCQYLLHCDPKERFSIVSFVWGPGQQTPVHDHTVWGLLGVLRGSEVSQRYVCGDGALHALGQADILESGAIDAVSPSIGDVHQVRNGLRHRPSVSIHVYGGNIGAINRHVFSADGNTKAFCSGYSSPLIPNIWSP